MKLDIINPATGQCFQSFETISSQEAHTIIGLTQSAYQNWHGTNFTTRSTLLNKVADLLIAREADYAAIMTQEMGKPITQAKAEIQKCANVCRHYASEASNYLQGRVIKTELSKSYVAYKPIGIVFAIMPWNYPFWQVFRFAAPTLMAGNAVLLKHAPNSTATALAIEELFKDAGAPENLFRSLVIDNDVAAEVIQHPSIKAVTLTGSERAGAAVGASAGAALKKIVLELGGSDPYLILDDADLDLAAQTCVQYRFNNCGQACISPKRIIVTETIQAAFTERVASLMQPITKGDPMDPECKLGPIAREDLRDNLARQVKASIDAGAKCLIGGRIDDGPGFYYPATLLTDVRPGMPAYEEELFGPVMCIIPVKNEEEAIAVANQSPYGLSAGVFTEDLDRGEKIATDQLDAGICCLNTCAASDPRLPFGGIKQSGYGRELSAEGIHEFCNVKTICIK